MKKIYLVFAVPAFMLTTSCKSVSPTVTTIYIDRWHTKYRYSVLNKTDTIYQDKEIVIHSPPEKYIPSFYRWCTRVFIISVILIICYIILRVIIKIYLKR